MNRVPWWAWVAGGVVAALALNARRWSLVGDTARAYGWENFPPPAYWLDLWALDRAFGRLPAGTVATSAFRTPEVGWLVGSPDPYGSRHAYGRAVDVVHPDLSMRQLARAAQDTGDWSFVLDEGTHVHLEV